MRRFLKNTFLLAVIVFLLYTINQQYNLAELVIDIAAEIETLIGNEELNGKEDTNGNEETNGNEAPNENEDSNTNTDTNENNEANENKETNSSKKEDSFIKKVRIAMLEGKEQTSLRYLGKVDNMNWFSEDAIDIVYSIDDTATSSDYDYLRYNTSSIYASIKGIGNIMNIDYDFEYNETEVETAKVDKRISELFGEWKIKELSDYKKIKKIHDYIINNASYDVSLENYSAYNNLIDQSSTCQGYMVLAYKMLTEAGIPCRIISGTGNGESHGWNIVQLDGIWYNLDCTWDDPLTPDGEAVLVYDYFLKSDEEFKDHIRDKEFRTEKFYKEYEIGDKSYGE